MDDLISRQDAIDAICIDWCYRKYSECPYFDNVGTDEKYCDGCDAVFILKDLPSALPERLTDNEQRIFLAAMLREKKICMQVDDEYRTCREPHQDSLVSIFHEIIRKVKGALWTI